MALDGARLAASSAPWWAFSDDGAIPILIPIPISTQTHPQSFRTELRLSFIVWQDSHN